MKNKGTGWKPIKMNKSPPCITILNVKGGDEKIYDRNESRKTRDK